MKLNNILARLNKLIVHFDNSNPNEAHNAFLKSTELLKSAGLDWRDYCALMSDKEGSVLDVLCRLLEKDSEALVRLGRAGATRYFCNSEGAAYADIVIEGRRETLPLMSAEFVEWLTFLFYGEKRKAPASAATKNAIQTLSAHARFEGGRQEVDLRVARCAGKIYLDPRRFGMASYRN